MRLSTSDRFRNQASPECSGEREGRIICTKCMWEITRWDLLSMLFFMKSGGIERVSGYEVRSFRITWSRVYEFVLRINVWGGRFWFWLWVVLRSTSGWTAPFFYRNRSISSPTIPILLFWRRLFWEDLMHTIDAVFFLRCSFLYIFQLHSIWESPSEGFSLSWHHLRSDVCLEELREVLSRFLHSNPQNGKTILSISK